MTLKTVLIGMKANTEMMLSGAELLVKGLRAMSRSMDVAIAMSERDVELSSPVRSRQDNRVGQSDCPKDKRQDKGQDRQSDTLSFFAFNSSSSGEEKEAENGGIASEKHAEKVAATGNSGRVSDSDSPAQDNRTGQQDRTTGQQDSRTIGQRSMRVLMAAVWDGMDGATVSGAYKGRLADCEPLLRRLAAEQGLEPLDLFRAAVKRFKSDPKVRAGRFGLAAFLSQLEQWCWPDAVAPAATRAGTPEEHAAEKPRNAGFLED